MDFVIVVHWYAPVYTAKPSVMDQTGGFA